MSDTHKTSLSLCLYCVSVIYLMLADLDSRTISYNIKNSTIRSTRSEMAVIVRTINTLYQQLLQCISLILQILLHFIFYTYRLRCGLIIIIIIIIIFRSTALCGPWPPLRIF